MRAMIIACLGLVLAGARLDAQPPTPKPGPEHEALKKFAGDWDATVAFMGNESKGTYHSQVALGGFWLIGNFQGEFGGAKFEGRATMGYDPAKKKYVSSWVDSMGPSITTGEGSFDADGKIYTETGEGTGPDGKPMKVKSVYAFSDADNMTLTMYNVADGKEQEFFKITYKRKK